MKNFQNLVVHTKATPINFESVFHDKYYSNISEYRLGILRQLLRMNYDVLESMIELEESIEQYLKE